MRYSVEHKDQTRQTLLESSASMAKESGFSPLGVDALMKAIGLTGGAFYSHFPAKDDLFYAVIERELSNSVCRLGANGALDRAMLKKCLAQYLSMAHVQAPGKGCALPSLGAEIARAQEDVRLRAEHWLCELHRLWAATLESEKLAWAAIAQSVGALVVARMLSTPALQHAVVDASREVLFSQIDAIDDPIKA